MTRYVLASHGTLAIAAKEALQMIVGEREEVRAVGLSPEDGPDELSAALQGAVEGLGEDERLIVFTDLKGGSPHNASMREFGQRPHTTIISGLSLPMVLDTVLSKREDAQKIAATGRKSITVSGTDVGETDAAPAAAAPAAPAQPATPAKPGVPKDVVHVRVDARGIHGQVATTWLPQLNVDRVMVIDPKAVKSDMQKMALRTAAPEQVKLSVLSPEYASQRLADPNAYPGERILVLLLDPTTLDALAEHGTTFPHVNLGNMPARAGAERLTRTVYLTQADRAALRRAKDSGTKVTAQMVPSDAAVTLGDDQLYLTNN